MVERYLYDAYGVVEVRDGSWTVQSGGSAYGFVYQFQGMRHETVADYYATQTRIYSAPLGRFISTDWIGFRGGDQNLYRFVGNGPVNALDPSGLADTRWWDFTGPFGLAYETWNWFQSPSAAAMRAPISRPPGDITDARSLLDLPRASDPNMDGRAAGLAAAAAVRAMVVSVGEVYVNALVDRLGAGAAGKFAQFLEKTKGWKFVRDKVGNVTQILTKKGGLNKTDLTLAEKEYCELFKVGKHGQIRGTVPGQHSHHGVMSEWMKKKYPGYSANKAPAILMPEAFHQDTFGVFNKWRAEMARKMGGRFDWGRVSQAEIRALSENMFDAAGVPNSVRQQYWAEFEGMLGALGR